MTELKTLEAKIDELTKLVEQLSKPVHIVQFVHGPVQTPVNPQWVPAYGPNPPFVTTSLGCDTNERN